MVYQTDSSIFFLQSCPIVVLSNSWMAKYEHQWIGLREHFEENPILNGKINGVWYTFFLQPIHWLNRTFLGPVPHVRPAQFAFFAFGYRLRPNTPTAVANRPTAWSGVQKNSSMSEVLGCCGWWMFVFVSPLSCFEHFWTNTMIAKIWWLWLL